MTVPSASAVSSTAAAAPSTTQQGLPHNDADVMFAQHMIPHHQQAIEMADLLLAKDGINTQVSDLARQIKAAQAPEITRMSGWLAGWGENPSPSMTMDHDTGVGMMNQTDMDALEKATGDKATRLFLAGMIEHHTGAIAMVVESELLYTIVLMLFVVPYVRGSTFLVVFLQSLSVFQVSDASMIEH